MTSVRIQWKFIAWVFIYNYKAARKKRMFKRIMEYVNGNTIFIRETKSQRKKKLQTNSPAISFFVQLLHQFNVDNVLNGTQCKGKQSFLFTACLLENDPVPMRERTLAKKAVQ